MASKHHDILRQHIYTSIHNFETRKTDLGEMRLFLDLVLQDEFGRSAIASRFNLKTNDNTGCQYLNERMRG
jgi:hypothetical protein